MARYDTVYQEKSDTDRDLADAVTTSFSHNFSNGWVIHGILRDIWHVDKRHALENAAVTTTTVEAHGNGTGGQDGHAGGNGNGNANSSASHGFSGTP